MLNEAVCRDDQGNLKEVGQAGSTFLMASMTRSSLEHHSQAPASCCAARSKARRSPDLSADLPNLQAIERGRKTLAECRKDASNAHMYASHLCLQYLADLRLSPALL